MNLGKEFLVGVVIALLGFFILSTLGHITSAPSAILFGTFIAGIFTRDIKYGALVGLLVAFVVGLILFVIASILFLMGVLFIITLVLAMLAQFVWGIISVVTIYLIPIIIFSPFVGAFGGFIGKIISGPKEEEIPTSGEVYMHRSVDYSNKIVCPWCGTSNNISNICCKNC